MRFVGTLLLKRLTNSTFVYHYPINTVEFYLETAELK